MTTFKQKDEEISKFYSWVNDLQNINIKTFDDLGNLFADFEEQIEEAESSYDDILEDLHNEEMESELENRITALKEIYYRLNQIVDETEIFSNNISKIRKNKIVRDIKEEIEGTVLSINDYLG